MKSVWVLLLTVAASLPLTAPAGAAAVATGRAAAIERLTFDEINSMRSARRLRPLAMHAGLREVARDHSADMAASQRVGHWYFEDRLEQAPADPMQLGGGPDEGIWGIGIAACENALYRYRAGSTQETDQQVARALAAQWAASREHARCMFDPGLNAAGLGIYRDVRGAWWATLEVVRDDTPPGGLTRCGADVPGATVNACSR